MTTPPGPPQSQWTIVTPSDYPVDPSHVAYIASLGFSPEEARAALVEARGDLERGIETIVHNTHARLGYVNEDCTICAYREASAAYRRLRSRSAPAMPQGGFVLDLTGHAPQGPMSASVYGGAAEFTAPGSTEWAPAPPSLAPPGLVPARLPQQATPFGLHTEPLGSVSPYPVECSPTGSTGVAAGTVHRYSSAPGPHTTTPSRTPTVSLSAPSPAFASTSLVGSPIAFSSPQLYDPSMSFSGDCSTRASTPYGSPLFQGDSHMASPGPGATTPSPLTPDQLGGLILGAPAISHFTAPPPTARSYSQQYLRQQHGEAFVRPSTEPPHNQAVYGHNNPAAMGLGITGPGVPAVFLSVDASTDSQQPHDPTVSYKSFTLTSDGDFSFTADDGFVFTVDDDFPLTSDDDYSFTADEDLFNDIIWPEHQHSAEVLIA